MRSSVVAAACLLSLVACGGGGVPARGDSAAGASGGPASAPNASEQSPSGTSSAPTGSTSASASTTPTSTDLVGFVTPSGNLHCYVNGAPSAAEARCDIVERDWPAPPPPTGCTQGGWGNALSVDATGPHFVCAGDSAYNENVVPYGTSVRSGAFQCDVAESGVTCRDASTGRGFSIARGSYRFF